MALRPPLTHKPAIVVHEETPTLEPKPVMSGTPDASTSAGKGRGVAYRSPSRTGKRAAVAWLEPETVKQLNMIAIQRDIHVQDILVQAINRWLISEGLPRFDEEK